MMTNIFKIIFNLQHQNQIAMNFSMLLVGNSTYYF